MHNEPMILGMLGAGPIAPAPSGGMLVLTVVLAVAAYVALRVVEELTMPERPEPAETAGGLRKESPAIVNMLTNDATVTAAGFRATVVDLAARGWLRILPPDDDDELARVRPAAGAGRGDALLPHERLVLQHIMARFTTDHAIPARYLAVDVRGSWWKRFSGLVSDEAFRAGLVCRRWNPIYLGGPAILVLLSLLTWWASVRGEDPGVAVVDSIERRAIAWGVLVLIVVTAWRLLAHAFRREWNHTEAGRVATRQWLNVRQRLVEAGFGPMAPSAMEEGDRRLAYATAMCLAEGAAIELPLAREDHYRAWSAVGGHGRLVRISYPIRLGYGLQPFVALAVGLVACFAGMWARSWFADVARGDALQSLYERYPDQDWVISHVATGFAVLAFVPIVTGLWMAVCGAADGFNTVERTGMVLRARRPAEVVPFPRPIRRLLERDRYTIYIAIDDGSSDAVVAWRATERSAVPQGSNAIVRASPLLGYVRKSTPVGFFLPES
jgi:hypothetical protein